MKSSVLAIHSFLLILGTAVAAAAALAEGQKTGDYERSRWHPIHFKPAIEQATNEQCLACHQDILDRRVLDQSPAGVKASEVTAWYQTLNTYTGAQETFHRRHLVTPMAQELMDMKCITCHQGNDPREESPAQSTEAKSAFTLRKMVDPKTCLMCHGQFDSALMALPGPWHEVNETFGNSCLTCHAAIRTNRHKVNFLKPQAIEQAGAKDADVCYGCHGGRAWYRISYPFPRHPWPGMAEEVPAWAKDRPTASEQRFLAVSKEK